MPGIDYTLGMKTSGFDSGVGGALGKLTGLGAKVAAITAAAGLAAGIGLGAIIAKSIGKAADMETQEAAFAPLLGGAEKARARIAELAAYAAATPFELPEIAAASRVLETLTKGALATGRGLTLVGDIASATNQPFSEIAVSVGRLYDGLQSGRPVGEAMQRLQELGVISGETRGKIEDLQKEGKKGAEVWSVAERAMGSFSGSMERQSVTWNGLMSTLSDTIAMTMATFGKPIMDSLKPYLQGLTMRIEDMKTIALAAGQKIASAFDTALAAFQTGSITALLGDGLVLAFIDGVNAFSSALRGTLAFLQAAMKQIMGDVAKSLGLSELLGIFTDLANGIGSIITAAILKGLTTLDPTGLLGIDESARREQNAAGNSFRRAGNRIADFDGGAAVRDLFTSLGDAATQGKAAFIKAAGDPLIDRAPAAARFADTLAPINARIAENKAKSEADAAKLDARLSGLKSAADSAAAAPAASAASSRPAVADRLAQIGGYVGGASAALTNRLAERTAKGVESTSKGIDKLIAYSLRRPTSAAGAVF